MNCKNCTTEINSKFCPNCGQPASLKRIDGHYIIHEIEHVLHFERGILYTIRELLRNPGESIRHFITANRGRLVKPIIFIIVTSLIYTIITRFFHIDEFFIKYKGPKGAEKPAFSIVLDWLKVNYGYLNILSGVLIAIWLKVFFKKYGYNFFELLVMLCYVLGISIVISTFFAIIEGVTHFKLSGIATIIGWIYVVIAIGSFYGSKKITNYIYALICYFLGLISFSILIFTLGLVIDFVAKK